MRVPRYASIPEHWKAPFGPYRQAPNEYGGEWWYVNPFTGMEPWLNEPREAEELPPGFEEIFGPRPQASDYRGKGGNAAFQVALADWQRDLKHFKGVGVPEWTTEAELEKAEAVFKAWGMGDMWVFEGRYGWSAAFPDSKIKSYDVPAQTAIEATHLAVAQYQIALLQAGVVPDKKHPFVPPHMWPDFEGEVQ